MQLHFAVSMENELLVPGNVVSCLFVSEMDSNGKSMIGGGWRPLGAECKEESQPLWRRTRVPGGASENPLSRLVRWAPTLTFKFSGPYVRYILSFLYIFDPPEAGRKERSRSPVEGRL